MDVDTTIHGQVKLKLNNKYICFITVTFNYPESQVIHGPIKLNRQTLSPKEGVGL